MLPSIPRPLLDRIVLTYSIWQSSIIMRMSLDNNMSRGDASTISGLYTRGNVPVDNRLAHGSRFNWREDLELRSSILAQRAAVSPPS